MKMPQNLWLPLYGEGKAELIGTIGGAHGTMPGDGANDVRRVEIFRYPNGDKIVIKSAKNDFTTPERVAGWAKTAAFYNSLGIYAPAFLPSVNGRYAERSDGFIFFAEEFMRGAELGGLSTEISRDFRDTPLGERVLETIGTVAANRDAEPEIPWHTAWCIYDKFSSGDPCDEREEYARAFLDYFKRNLPRHCSRAGAVFAEYMSLRADFEHEYRALPTAVFQGDLGNFLIDNDGNFVGVFDFNLSGSETVINYALCECRSTLSDMPKDISPEELLSSAAQEVHDTRMKRYLAAALKNYRLSTEERAAFNTYYKIAYPFLHGNWDRLKKILDKRGESCADLALGWIERHIRRNDAELLLTAVSKRGGEKQV